MNRVQLALNVPDLDEAVAFYSRMFSAEPAKRREGYANFALDQPALKLVLIENPDATEHLNHLGVEVATPDDVRAAAGRLTEQGLQTREEDATTCCYAVQDKVWVEAPNGAPWEIYTVLSDVPEGATHDGRELALVGAESDACGVDGCC